MFFFKDIVCGLKMFKGMFDYLKKKPHTLYFEPDLGKLGVQLLGRSCKKHTVAGYKI